MPKVGIVGSLVWDLIYGRDPLAPPVEEWGGIAYALAGLDASLGPDWEIVPLIKVGRDLSREAQQLLNSLTRLAPGARCVEVTAPEQPGRAALSVQRAALRANGRRRARLDLGRAGADGTRSRRGVRQLHLRLRAVPGNRPGAAARLPAGRSTPTSTACSSACSRTECGCFGRWSTPRTGSAASISCSSTRMRCASSHPIP